MPRYGIEPAPVSFVDTKTGGIDCTLGWKVMIEAERTLTLPHTHPSGTTIRLPDELILRIIRLALFDHEGLPEASTKNEYSWLQASPRLAAADSYKDRVTGSSYKVIRGGLLAVSRMWNAEARRIVDGAILVYDDQPQSPDTPFSKVELDFAISRSSLVGELGHPLGYDLLHAPLSMTRPVDGVVVCIQNARVRRGVLAGLGVLREINKCSWLMVQLLDKGGEKKGVLILKDRSYERRNSYASLQHYMEKAEMPFEAAESHWEWTISPMELDMASVSFLYWSREVQAAEEETAEEKWASAGEVDMVGLADVIQA